MGRLDFRVGKLDDLKGRTQARERDGLEPETARGICVRRKAYVYNSRKKNKNSELARWREEGRKRPKLTLYSPLQLDVYGSSIVPVPHVSKLRLHRRRRHPSITSKAASPSSSVSRMTSTRSR
jgi:hypothetical protein